MFRPVINDHTMWAPSGQLQTGAIKMPFTGTYVGGSHSGMWHGGVGNSSPPWRNKQLERRFHGREQISCSPSSEEALGKPVGQNGFISETGVIHDIAKAINFLHKNSCSNAFTKRQLECKQLIVKAEWLFSGFHFELDGEMFTSPIDMIDVESKQEKIFYWVNRLLRNVWKG